MTLTVTKRSIEHPCGPVLKQSHNFRPPPRPAVGQRVAILFWVSEHFAYKMHLRVPSGNTRATGSAESAGTESVDATGSVDTEHVASRQGQRPVFYCAWVLCVFFEISSEIPGTSGENQRRTWETLGTCKENRRKIKEFREKSQESLRTNSWASFLR